MFKKFLILGVTALSMVATSAIAADASRARLMIPVSTSVSDDSSSESPTVSGYSLHYVSSMGVGAGLSSTAVKQGDLTTTVDFLDISYTFGDTFTTQVAFQYPYGAKMEETGNDALEGKSASGQAFALNFGYDFGGFEGILGLMSESTKLKYEFMGVEGSEPYERTALHTSVGVGFVF